jgi:hypothetical protein
MKTFLQNTFRERIDLLFFTLESGLIDVVLEGIRVRLIQVLKLYFSFDEECGVRSNIR